LVFDSLCSRLRGEEILLASLTGEDSTFVRFNQAKIRSAGDVHENSVTLDLVRGDRHACAASTLTGEIGEDTLRLEALLDRLREVVAVADPDPHLSFAIDRHDTFDVRASSLPPDDLAVAAVLEAAGDGDLVGVLARGPIRRGFASSAGQRNWFESDVFHLDVSFHGGRRTAAKVSLGGADWTGADVAAHIQDAHGKLALLQALPYEPPPGRYRAYLAPRALEEILRLLGWGGFGLESHETRQTPLIKMVSEGRTLHPAVTLRDDHAASLAAPFTSRGFVKPNAVVLVEAGRYRHCLADARSAKRYGVPVNAEGESPEALDLAPGELRAADAAELVGDGLFISDIWYTNFSDRTDCRVTGVTRYACFWVEGGRLARPLAVMRLDDSIYNMLGDGLVGLTEERERLVDQHSYGSRSLASMHLPGIVVDGLRIAS
jgi:predicted Zn-dependent protease